MKISLLIRRAVRITLFVTPLALFGNIVYTLYEHENTDFLSIFKLQPGWLLLALVFSLSPWLFSIARLSLWSQFFKLKLTTRQISEAVLANEVAAITTPTAVGGGYAKVGLLMLAGVSPGMAASLMVIGSIEDYLLVPVVVAVCWTFFPPENIHLAAAFSRYMPEIELSTYAIFAATTLLLFSTALFFPRVRLYIAKFFQLSWWRSRILAPFLKAIIDFKTAFVMISKGGKSRFFLTTVLATAQWILRYSVFTAIAFGLGYSPDPVEFFLLQWLVFMLLNIVPTPGAIGGAEMIFMYIFKGFIPADSLALAAGYWRFVATYFQLMIAALLLMAMERPEIHLRKKPVRAVLTGRQKPARQKVTVVENNRLQSSTFAAKAISAEKVTDPASFPE